MPLALAIYFLSGPTRWKNFSLLLLSLLFYAWGEPWFVLIMVGSVALNFFSGLLIDGANGKARAAALAAALTANLAILAVFKYAAFAVGTLNTVAGLQLVVPSIVLPLGISFFTFHCMSYLIDVYRGQFPANRRFTEMALYIALFPQLIAGPIVRYKTIARRLAMRRHTLGRASAGMRIFIIGLAQKVLLADEAARLANIVFDGSGAPSFADSWISVFSYTLQIYFDFAGYSNMAIGLGLIFGFSLPRNFRLPYTSQSITEFWRRWHISLSTWFRDYVYIPLGGSRLGPLKTYRNLVIVFVLCGLWHGASWTFVLWGLYHGLFLVLERLGLGAALARTPRLIASGWTLLVVMVGWVFFRANSLEGAIAILESMVGMHGWAGLGDQMKESFHSLQHTVLIIGAALALIPKRQPSPKPRDGILRALTRQSAGALQAVAVTALLLLSLLSISGGTYSPFLYFRF